MAAWPARNTDPFPWSSFNVAIELGGGVWWGVWWGGGVVCCVVLGVCCVGVCFGCCFCLGGLWCVGVFVGVCVCLFCVVLLFVVLFVFVFFVCCVCFFGCVVCVFFFVCFGCCVVLVVVVVVFVCFFVVVFVLVLVVLFVLFCLFFCFWLLFFVLFFLFVLFFCFFLLGCRLPRRSCSSSLLFVRRLPLCRPVGLGLAVPAPSAAGAASRRLCGRSRSTGTAANAGRRCRPWWWRTASRRGTTRSATSVSCRRSCRVTEVCRQQPPHLTRHRQRYRRHDRSAGRNRGNAAISDSKVSSSVGTSKNSEG